VWTRILRLPHTLLRCYTRSSHTFVGYVDSMFICHGLRLVAFTRWFWFNVCVLLRITVVNVGRLRLLCALVNVLVTFVNGWYLPVGVVVDGLYGYVWFACHFGLDFYFTFVAQFGWLVLTRFSVCCWLIAYLMAYVALINCSSRLFLRGLWF